MSEHLCPICQQPERVIEYRHLGVTVTDCENADCPMCSDGWAEWRGKLETVMPHNPLSCKTTVLAR